MECFIVDSNDVFIHDRKLYLHGDEARHAIRSLRMRSGEQLLATDLAGTCYHAELIGSQEIDRKDLQAECAILNILPAHHEPTRSVFLGQAILQQPSHFEEIVEKSTELGISGFIPMITERTEKKHINSERIERIMREATKQVSRARIPRLSEPTKFKDAIAGSAREQRTAIILHEAARIEEHLSYILRNNTASAMTIFIGPEGGFTNEEVAFAQDQGALVASLGPRRLRAETAAIAAVSLVSLLEKQL